MGNVDLYVVGQSSENFNEGGFGVSEGLADIVSEGVIGATRARIKENVETKMRANSRTESR
ncbi:hypothetical protein J1N35_000543 [Gossypium stocksii]|uniref:Uncharacterized protein n=1 Tax=Gossypium stocksii TaxID=47602 RepID=A0A9D4AIR4_9ROSI|nr:hypothetical protein J1N35_000543 [Gossypium stocksii]